jgi:hypothetical protein
MNLIVLGILLALSLTFVIIEAERMVKAKNNPVKNKQNVNLKQNSGEQK